MIAADLRHWQSEMGFTYDTAAEALGVSRRTYAAWVLGESKIPGTVPLACAALAKGLKRWRYCGKGDE